MAKEAWAPSKKQGEDESDYKKRYYSAQREHAEETGDQATTDKIYKKLGKQSHSVDSNAVDKAALGTVASVMASRIPAMGKLPQELGMARPVAKALKPSANATKVVKDVPKELPGGASRSLAKSSQDLGIARPVAKALKPSANETRVVKNKPTQKSMSWGKGQQSAFKKALKG
jgi:hypothetical protein